MILILVTTVFYFLLPLLGAYLVRQRWRSLRYSVLESSRLPMAEFSDLQVGGRVRRQFFGRLEAWEGRHILWLTDGNLSIQVDVAGVDFWFLQTPDDESWSDGLSLNRHEEPGEPPRRVFWTDLRALPEGASFWVAGLLQTNSSGLASFSQTPEQRLLLVAYEGRSKTVVTRTLWSSRQRIEHWNFITPLSLAVGLASLLVVGYFDLRRPGGRPEGLIALAFALVPSTFFLPPGIAFFYAFNKVWTESRLQRGLRDLTFLHDPANHRARAEFKKKARQGEILAQVLFLVGAGANAGLLLILLRLWIH